jgi:hypothetical protein
MDPSFNPPQPFFINRSFPMTSFKKIAAALAFASVATGSALAAPVTYNVDASHTFPRF